MRGGRVAGVEIIINNWFLALSALFAAAGLTGKLLLVFSAVLWHELAHTLMAAGLGYKVKQVEILPFGAMARIERLADAGAASEIMIAAAGPLASLGLAAASYAGMVDGGSWQEICKFYFEVNLMLVGFNLLPALPLDGGRILRAILSCRRNYRSATAIVVALSNIISCILLVLVVLGYWLNNNINLTMLVAAGFLLITAKAELNLAGFRTMRIMSRKKAELTASGIMPTSHYIATADAAVSDIIHMFGSEQYYVILVIDCNYKLCGTLTETEVWEGMTERGIHCKVSDFL